MAEVEFGQQQLILARSTADGIEVYFKALISELSAISSDMHDIFQTASKAKSPLSRTYHCFPCKTSIRVLDRSGVMRGIYPFEGWRKKLIGRNYSHEKYFQQAMTTGRISFSGLLRNEQGDLRIRIAVPIYPYARVGGFPKNAGKVAGNGTMDFVKKSREPEGVLLGSIDPEVIAREFVSPVVSGQTGYAWLLDGEGTFVAHQVKDFVGRNAFGIRREKESSLSYEAVHKIQVLMMEGEEGIGHYVSAWHRDREGEVEKLVAYAPVHLQNALWSVAVCAPMGEVDAIVSRTHRMEWYCLGLVTFVLILCGIFLFVINKRWAHCLEQRLTQQATRFKQARNRHQQVLEHMRNAVAIFEPVDDGLDFILKSLNRAGQKIEQVDREKMLGKSIREIFPGFITSELFDAFRRVWVTGNAEQVFVKGVNRDQVVQWRKIYIYGLPSGENVMVYTDETEREQGKRALEDSEKRLRAIVNASPVGISLVINRRIDWLNRAMMDMLGYEEKAGLLGKDAAMLYVDQEEYLRVGRELYTIADGGETRSLETKWVRKDGSALDSYLQICAVDPQDLSRGHIVAVIDVTEQKKNDRQQKELRDRIRQMEKMESIGFLAGGIAHDFNNILFPIVGYTELLLQEAPQGSELHELLERIFNAAGRATELVQQILTFSRQGDTGLKPLRIQPVVKEALKLLRASIPSTIEISQEIGAECGMIMGNATQIHQIIMNLCTNAYHAMEERGGELNVALAEIDWPDDSHAAISMKPGRYLELTVTDTGQGMTPEVLKRIFEPYFTTKKVGKGTGMGLSVVFGIVKEFGGEIRVESEPGKGSRFHVYLPVVRNGIKRLVSSHDENLFIINGRVLLVDDDEDALFVQMQMLIQLGCRVTYRKSAMEALSLFHEAPDSFDLVITDLTMPKMTGDKLARALLDIRPDIPVLLCTGSGAAMSREIAENLGIMGFFRKPVKIHELAEVVHRALENSDKPHKQPFIFGNQA